MSSLDLSGYGAGPSGAGSAGWTGGSFRRVRTKETARARLVVTPDGVVANTVMANSSTQLPHGYARTRPVFSFQKRCVGVGGQVMGSGSDLPHGVVVRTPAFIAVREENPSERVEYFQLYA